MVSVLYHFCITFLLFVRLEAKRHPQGGGNVRSKVLAMMSFCVALTSLASYHNLSNWFGHFSWF